MTDEVSPERFQQAREYAAEAGEQLDVVELAYAIEGAVENDPAPRTIQSGKALGFVAELLERLEGDDV